jgi:hypothetical protein
MLRDKAYVLAKLEWMRVNPFGPMVSVTLDGRIWCGSSGFAPCGVGAG